MSSKTRLYISNMGLVSALGMDAKMNSVAFRAGVNRYAESQYYSKNIEPICLAEVPDGVFADLSPKVGLAEQSSRRHGRIVLAAQHALDQAVTGHPDNGNPLTLLQACPAPLLTSDEDFNRSLIGHIISQSVNSRLFNGGYKRQSMTGRAGVIELVDLAFAITEQMASQFILVSGSDSFDDADVLNLFETEKRLNVKGAMNGFTPGEGAGSLLLTPHKELAMVKNGVNIAISRPALGFEPGHLYSDAPYLGQGLSDTLTELLARHSNVCIKRVYSSMNGESHWAKEYGVARIRHSAQFSTDEELLHPADCFGDLGAATGAALLILAAHDHFANASDDVSLIYASSDRGQRAALLMHAEVA